MIYEILSANIPSALSSGGKLIIISGDSQYALVKSANAIEAINEYDELQLQSIVKETKWRQPCIDCEV
jgi:hypothetical protein